MIQKMMVISGLCALLLIMYIPISAMADQDDISKYRDLEETRLENKLETIKRIYFAKSINEQHRCRSRYNTTCLEIRRKIRQLRMDPEQYFFEEARRDRNRTDLIEIKHR